MTKVQHPQHLLRLRSPLDRAHHFPAAGVESLSINSFQKTCIISHCPSCCSPDLIVSKLNGAGLGATLLGQGHLEIDAAPNFMEVWQEHARYLIVIVSLLFMLLGLLCTLPVSLEKTFLLLALLLGLCGILRECVVSLMKGNMEISSLVVLAALAAAMQGQSADAALVVLLFNISKAVESVAFSRVSSALRAVLQLQAAHTIHSLGGKAVPISELTLGTCEAVSSAPKERVVRTETACIHVYDLSQSQGKYRNCTSVCCSIPHFQDRIAVII